MPIRVACCDWRDPLNVGAAFRLADAFGATQLILGGSTPHPPHRKISRTARSTEQWIEWRAAPDLAVVLLELRAEGHHLIGLEITDRSQPIQSFSFDQLQPLVLVVGAEQHGISPSILQVLDDCAHIPMLGRNSSMNVAAALAVALYEISRQWAAGL